MKPISVQLYSVREEAAKDFPAVLKKIADIGYKGVEFAGIHNMKPAEVKKIVDDLGLQVSSAHMPMPTPDNKNDLIDQCKALGNTKLISGFGPDQFKTIQGTMDAAAKFEKAAALLEGTGIQFGFHNHWWEFQMVEGKLPEALVLRKVPGIFAEVDVYWAAAGGADPATAVACLSDRIPVLHIKDGPMSPKQPMTAVGAGKLDMFSIINAADPDVLEWVIVELDSCATDMMAAVEQSYKFLTKAGLAQGNK